MNREEILNRMPMNISYRCRENMINQDRWKFDDDEDYIDEFHFLSYAAFSFENSEEGEIFWRRYTSMLTEFECILIDLKIRRSL
tara:strand:- start:188 stop:439 length:252 start_codon:yes stop_codon:yes gene_type:complete